MVNNAAKKCSIAAAVAALYACGGGGGGADPLGELPGLPISGQPVSGGNASVSKFNAMEDAALASYGYRQGMWLAGIFGDVVEDGRRVELSGAGGVSACANGGEVTATLLDNDRDGALSVRDQIDLQYRDCSGAEGAMNGSARLSIAKLSDRNSGTEYDVSFDLALPDGELEGTLGVTRDDSFGTFRVSAGGLDFGVSQASFEYGGIATTMQSLSIESKLRTDTNSYAVHFDVHVLEDGLGPIGEGVAWSVGGVGQGRAFSGRGGENPTAGSMQVTRFATFLSALEMTVAPDPAYVTLTSDPSVLVKGDERVESLTWEDFLSR